MADTAVDRESLARDLVAAAYLEGDFVLASGRRSRYYFDKYRFETQPQLLAPVGRLIAQRVPAGTQRIAGPELGAVALAAAASMASGVPCLFVRGEAKAYGTSKQIEGVYEPGDLTVVVEDVLTSGGSAIKAAEALTAAGCKVVRIIGVIDREEGAGDAVWAAGYELEALFTRTELDRWLR
ncbi:MAG: orotate phosphoribosyltransferase [Chloroflexota bacterium]|nr:orotate phosphoribosyltransferase [Chloroflexota bacterium]